MKRPIIYSYIPVDKAQRACIVVLLVPPGEFSTKLNVDQVSMTDLCGIGKYGYKTFHDYLTYKVPGFHKFHFLTQGVILDKSIKTFVSKNFKRVYSNISRNSSDILYGFTGKGEIVIDKATLYMLIPKSSWKFTGNPPKLLQTIPQGLRLFHQQDTPEPEESCKYYIIKIPGTTQCTYLEPYDASIFDGILKTLDKI